MFTPNRRSPTCRGEGPVKIRFCSLFTYDNPQSNSKYLIDDAGSIYHYEEFFEWAKGGAGRVQITSEKLTGISPRVIGTYHKDMGWALGCGRSLISWRICMPRAGEITKLQEFYKKAPRDWVDAVWILPNDSIEGPFFYSKHNDNNLVNGLKINYLLNYMNILSANQETTTRFAVTIEEINSKYKKEREELKKVIAETARSQAEQILTNDSDDMGNPEELCNKLAELRLQYNAIVVKQKQETDSAMNEYKDEIITNMVSIK